jgi:hypothetical protein
MFFVLYLLYYVNHKNLRQKSESESGTLENSILCEVGTVKKKESAFD